MINVENKHILKIILNLLDLCYVIILKITIFIKYYNLFSINVIKI